MYYRDRGIVQVSVCVFYVNMLFLLYLWGLYVSILNNRDVCHKGQTIIICKREVF